jgi:hypothetical protein
MRLRAAVPPDLRRDKRFPRPPRLKADERIVDDRLLGVALAVASGRKSGLAPSLSQCHVHVFERLARAEWRIGARRGRLIFHRAERVPSLLAYFADPELRALEVVVKRIEGMGEQRLERAVADRLITYLPGLPNEDHHFPSPIVCGR